MLGSAWVVLQCYPTSLLDITLVARVRGALTSLCGVSAMTPRFPPLLSLRSRPAPARRRGMPTRLWGRRAAEQNNAETQQRAPLLRRRRITSRARGAGATDSHPTPTPHETDWAAASGLFLPPPPPFRPNLSPPQVRPVPMPPSFAHMREATSEAGEKCYVRGFSFSHTDFA